MKNENVSVANKMITINAVLVGFFFLNNKASNEYEKVQLEKANTRKKNGIISKLDAPPIENAKE